MSEPVIRVDKLSKLYRIRGAPEHYRTLRDTLAGFGAASLRRLWPRAARRSPTTNGNRNSVWALKDISFEVQQGEVVGLIGRNGAGKSTLLKILSRITEPTSGHAEIRGRLGSLLEVGTGFHSELTGRENIYLSAAILGMRRAEIERKFDEIVAFAEVEKFLETPVKHYSSGMYLRLAFAVAAHLDPDILLVDEVLAVGDALFQQKCIEKMKGAAREGTTVLFVSHNMGAIEAFCPRALLFRQGTLARDSSADEVIRDYLAYLNAGVDQAFVSNPERSGTGGLRFTGARILDDSQTPTRFLVAGRPASIEFRYENPIRAKHAHISMTVFNHLGVAVTNFDTSLAEHAFDSLEPAGVVVCHVPCVPFPVGQYRIGIIATLDGETLDLVPNALLFDVKSSVFYNTPRTPPLKYCACMVAHEWRHEGREA